MKKSFVDADILAQEVPDIKLHQQSRQQEAPQCKSECPACGSASFKIGAGLRPFEESRRCTGCNHFLGYYSLSSKASRHRKRRKPGLEPISEILARLEFGGES